jgi:predicted nuclease of predicted toxin-antitoxin system
LATLLRSVLEIPLGRAEARRVGTLLGECRSADVVDGSIMDAAVDGDEILTSDPKDLAALAAACGKRVFITAV